MNSPKTSASAQPFSSAISSPFTQSWIQSLTLVASHPLARTIKPRLELVNTLSRSRAEADRAQAAKDLWELAQSAGLGELLDVLPVHRAQWKFPSDDNFLYRRRDAITTDDGVHEASNVVSGSFESWRQAIGLDSLEVPLTAEVFSGDWARLVRSEAVRLQQSLSLSAMPQATTLQLPCTARWDTASWSVSFDQVEWMVVRFDELPVMDRPTNAELQERLLRMLTAANSTLVNKQAANCAFSATGSLWQECVTSLQPLHTSLHRQAGEFSPWLLRTWNCVWPIVYREQHVLHERADIDVVRRELKACLETQTKLCLWMFLFAKLICQSQLTTGLGFCADFGD